MVKVSHEWQWKDVEEYQQAIRMGGIQTDWIKEIECAQKEVLARIEKHTYPLDASWLNWQPDQTWSVPYLPENWEGVNY